MPRVKVRFRKYKDIPFAVEQFTGVQYRCRLCNRIFLDKKELQAHLQWEANKGDKPAVSGKAPVPGQNITAKLLYTIDIHDHIRGQYLQTKDDITFDPYLADQNQPHKKGE